VFFYSRDRTGEHAEQHLRGYAGILQADAYAGFNRLYEADRKGGPITEAACWSHYLELGDLDADAIAVLALSGSGRSDDRDRRPLHLQHG
jgi:hypothetical protein